MSYFKFNYNGTEYSLPIFSSDSTEVNTATVKLGIGGKGYIIFGSSKGDDVDICRKPLTGDVYKKYKGSTASPTLAINKGGNIYFSAKSTNLYYGYKIVLNKNDGTSTTNSITGELRNGNFILTPSSSFTRTDYAFLKWNTKSDGTGNSYISQYDSLYASVLYNNGSNFNLYAIWSRIIYSILYKANGGSGSDVTQKFNSGDTATIKSNSFTRSYYTFSKWNTASNGTGISYNANESYNNRANLTLYAIWIATTYTCTYKANGGSGSDVTQSYSVENKPAVKGEIFVRANYRLSAWTETSTGGGTVCTVGAPTGTYFPLPNTLYAKWSAITYSDWAYSYGYSWSSSSTSGNTIYIYYTYEYTVSVKITSGYGHTYSFGISNEVNGYFSVSLYENPTTKVVTDSTTTVSCKIRIASLGSTGTHNATALIYLYDSVTGSEVTASTLSFSQSLTAGKSETSSEE